MLVTLEIADRLLQDYEPNDENERHQLEWMRESIRACYAKAEELPAMASARSLSRPPAASPAI